jgi:hypothetical protein
MPFPIDIVVGPVAGLLNNVIDRIFPDKDAQAQQRAELLLKAQEIDADLAKGQLAINQVEASSDNLFVAGWRPFIGWVCGVAFAYKFIIQPLVIFILLASGSTFDAKTLPVLDWAEMSTVLLGLLGLGTLRSIEKVKGA